MTATRQLTNDINSFFRATGQAELPVFGEESEWAELKKVKPAYTARLLEKMPQFKSISPQIRPDIFLQALNRREAELEQELHTHISRAS